MLPALVRHKVIRRGPDLALMLASIVLAFVVAEVGMRVYYRWRTALELSRMAKPTRAEVIDSSRGELGQGVTLSNLPNVIYELRPNLHGTYDGRKFRSDRYGFREDREIAVEKPSGVERVVGIGDSWMWGSGVDNGETYLDRLRERLSADGFRIEVINTGVWGYNARQQVATLRWKGLMFTPDVVVIGLCGNDREYTSFLNQRSFVDGSRSLVWSEIAGRLRRLAGTPPVAPPAPEDVMPFQEFTGAYAELFELAQSAHFSVVVFSECFGEGNPPSEHESCRLGSADEWRRFIAMLDGWGFHRCPWNIGEIPQNHPYYGHATAEGNRMLASVLARCLEPLLRRPREAMH